MSTTHAPRTPPTSRPLGISSEPATAAGTTRRPATPEFHALANGLAAPIANTDARHRYDRVLELLLAPGGANAAHLQPDAATPDVVRHRIAGLALAHLAPADHPRHHDLVREALAALAQ